MSRAQAGVDPARAASRTEPPIPLIVERPWGRFIQYVTNEPVTVKILEVRAGKRLSLQAHSRPSERMLPVSILSLSRSGAVRSGQPNLRWEVKIACRP